MNVIVDNEGVASVDAAQMTSEEVTHFLDNCLSDKNVKKIEIENIDSFFYRDK